MNKCIKLRTITSSDESQVRNYAESCSWRAGKTLASAMEHNEFSDWERIIVAVDNEKICGYCTVSKTDCIPDADCSPYIGFVFVDEEYRGNRLSRQLIEYVVDYIKNIGYNKVHIVSRSRNGERSGNGTACQIGRKTEKTYPYAAGRRNNAGIVFRVQKRNRERKTRFAGQTAGAGCGDGTERKSGRSGEKGRRFFAGI